MKKVFISLAVILFLLGTSVYATDTRLKGLGINNWMIEEDDNLIWLNPARVNDYSNLVWGELGVAAAEDMDGNPEVNSNLTIDKQWGGVSYGLKLGKQSVIAAFVGRPDTTKNLGLIGDVGESIGGEVIIPGGGFGNTLTPVNKFDIFYGLGISDKLKLGLMLNYASDSDTNEFSVTDNPNPFSWKTERKSSDTNIVIGGYVNDVGPISQLDASLTLSMPSVNNKYTGSNLLASNSSDDRELKTDGALGLSLNVRGIVGLNDAMKLIPFINYASFKVDNEYTDRRDTTGDNTLNTNYEQNREQQENDLTLGVALNSKINDKTLIITAVSLKRTKKITNAKTTIKLLGEEGIRYEYNSETTTTDIPLNIAVERVLSKTFTARLGVLKSIYKTKKIKEDDPTYGGWDGTAYPLLNTTTVESSKDQADDDGTEISLGMGANITDTFKLDAVVRQQVLFSGTYIVSGVPETLFGQLTATYMF